MNKNKLFLIFVFFIIIVNPGFKKKPVHASNSETPVSSMLDWEQFRPYIQEFNRNDVQLRIQHYPNDQAESFLKENIPYLNVPDKELERTYYFRWWTFRKHINKTPVGFVITEFLREIEYAGEYNTISCPAGHHFHEGRWLHNQTYLEDYANFWFKEGGDPRLYSFWAPYAIQAFASVHQNKDLLINLLPYLDKNYRDWEKSNLAEDGLFWQIDDRDGMEHSVGGSGKRVTINSYMAGDARAIAEIAKLAGNKELEEKYTAKARELKQLIISNLWDEDDVFFKTLPLDENELDLVRDHRHFDTFLDRNISPSGLVDVRELKGYSPWYFNIPGDEHSAAWKFLMTTDGFHAPYGPTTAEQSHPGFEVIYETHHGDRGTCLWNGPSWPYSTSVTLKAMGNLLRNYNQSYITKEDFIQWVQIYSNSHRRINEEGKQIGWIDENLNPFTGDWMSRTMRMRRAIDPHTLKYDQDSPQYERGKDYNHSSFTDIIISDLIGIIPSMESELTVHPLIPQDYWDWFCLDNVKYHDRMITILWDRDGSKYQAGKGFSVFVDGELKHHSDTLKKVTIELEE